MTTSVFDEKRVCTTAQRSGFWSRPTCVSPSLASWSERTSWQRLAHTGSGIEPSGFQAHVWYFAKFACWSQPTLVFGDVAHAPIPAATTAAAMNPVFTPNLIGPSPSRPSGRGHPLTPAFFPDRGA